MSDVNNLREQWLELVGALGYRNLDKSLNILFQWLVKHPSYTPAFWEQTTEQGSHVMMETLVKQADACCLLPLWLEEAPQLVNATNQNNQVLLHVLWDVCNTSPTLSMKKEHMQMIEFVQQNTAASHWTWLDKPNDSPASGWGKIITTLAGKYDWISLSRINENIHKVYPQKPKPIRWLTVTTEQQARSLYALGASLNDSIKFGSVSYPAWKCLVSAKDYNYANLSYAIGQGKFEDIDAEEIAAWKAETDKLKYLVPNDRRASTSYIKGVLAETRTDTLGRTSLDYLLQHRSDLLGKFIDTASLKPENLPVLFGKDKAGMGFGFRAMLFGSDRDVSMLKEFARRKNIPFECNIEKGWFYNEQNHQAWVAMLSGLGRPRLPSLSKLNETFSVAELFGPPEVQQVWEEKWDQWLTDMLQTDGKKIPNQPLLSRQLAILVDKKLLASPDLTEGLRSRIMCACSVLRRTGNASELFKMAGVSNSYHLSWSEIKDEDLPSVWTPSMIDVVLQSNIFNTNVTSGFRGTPEKNAQWVSEASKQGMLLEVAPSSAPSRKMKM